MSCDRFGPLLLDDGARTPEVVAHLEGCAKCRALVAADASAQQLRGLNWELPTRTREVPVRSLWRRRLLLRGTFACLAAGVAIAAVLAMPGAATVRSAQPVLSPSVATRGAIAEDALPKEDLRALMLEVDSYTREDVGAADPTLTAFGPLPQLLTPEAHH